MFLFLCDGLKSLVYDGFLFLQGRKFWKKYFVDAAGGVQEEVPWVEFQTRFWQDFVGTAKSKDNQKEEEDWFKCLRELFASQNSNREEVSMGTECLCFLLSCF